MASKSKDSKPLDIIKQFFKISKNTPVNYRLKADFVVSPELEKDLGPSSNIALRLKTIRDLSEVVLTNRIEEYGVEKIWTQVKDLLNRDAEKDHRHLTIHFLKCVIQGQYAGLGLMRVTFFQLIKRHDISEDIAPLFELLQELTRDGRDIHQLEDELGSFLANWLPSVAGAGRGAAFLDLLVNLIKYNAAYIDDADVFTIVEYSCFICCWSNDTQAVENSLKVLGAIVCYSELPGEALKTFVAALCRKVNTGEFTHACWKVMRDLLGTFMGHSTLLTLCKFLQDKGAYNDRALLRGAVFFIHMGLWSDKKVLTLKLTPTSVLPSMLQALECGHSLLIYEVMLCVQRLVNSYGLELLHPGWHAIIDVLAAVTKIVEGIDPSKIEVHPVDSLIHVSHKLHEILTAIENYIELSQFNGPIERVFELIELSAKVRPESSVLRLITHQTHQIKPTRPEWLTKLTNMTDRYYKNETRPNIRIKMIEVVSTILSHYRYIYEEELVERVVLTFFANPEAESELCVRNAVAQLLIAICVDSESKKCIDVLEILEKMLNRPFDHNPLEVNNEGDILDVKTAAVGLIRLFGSKLHQMPTCHAVRVFKVIIGHLELHYQHLNVLNFNHTIHLMMFEMLMKLRINRMGHVGLVESTGKRFSPFLIVESSAHQFGCPPPSPAPTLFSLSALSKVIILAMRQEKDWRIIQLILQELPTVLQNKALIADKYGVDVGLLVDALCAMVSDKSLNLPESLRMVPGKLPRTEFHSYVYPVIAAISAYHSYLEPSQQQKCIWCLHGGLNSKSAGQCVLAMTTCTLEMRDAMYKVLPEVLLSLSKISATVVIAVPILEFLSTLTSLPKVIASLMGSQYLSVFAIALPYTNPFKYNHYTVSLAHHVIAVWFLKCRQPFRKDFVKFIITGLQSNALAPFEESHVMKFENEDSTSRKRSSSLTEQGSRRRERPLPNTRIGGELRPPIDAALWNFHAELKETCIDLMARYTFSSCEARPTRSPSVEALLHGGQSQTWLLGHKLITVTTSGCSQKPLKNNLCDRCLVTCRIDRELLSPEVSDEKKFEKIKEETSQAEQVDPRLERVLHSAIQSKQTRDMCLCWCQGWAEIHVRRPTGEMSWVIRLENGMPCSTWDDQPMDLAALFMPSHLPRAVAKKPNTGDIIEGQVSGESSARPAHPSSSVSNPVSIPGSPTSRQSSRESLPVEEEEDVDDDSSDTSIPPPCYVTMPHPIMGGKSRNPVRRSNSSPEMSANWKNPFLKDKGLNYEDPSKARVSCEAIPEEMTPPDPPPPELVLGLRPSRLRLDVGLSVDVSVKNFRGPATTGEIEMHQDEHTALPSTTFTRDRSRTISVMSPVRKLEHGKPNKVLSPRNKEAPRSGVSPSFVFLQLYHSDHFGAPNVKPLLVSSSNAVLKRAVKALDSIPPFETHKVGVVYVGEGQAGNEPEILGNEFGSLRYAMFLQKLGTLINLKETDPQVMFLGGFDHNSGADGKFAYIWQDEVTQVVFHVATLMPNKESDPNRVAKKSHIGNDYVTIVYNESGENIPFMKLGQFTSANVVIEPMDPGSHKLSVKTVEELNDFGHKEEKIVSDDNLPILARQLAIHANLASEVYGSLKTNDRDPYASNWLERLRKIKRLRTKLLEFEESSADQQLRPASKRPDPIDDFTEYT